MGTYILRKENRYIYKMGRVYRRATGDDPYLNQLGVALRYRCASLSFSFANQNSSASVNPSAASSTNNA